MASPSVDRALIEHIAQLSSLSLTKEEGDKLTQEVAAILRYVGELDSLDTSNVPPTAQVGVRREPALRTDEARPCLSHDEALSQAPRVAEGGFAVPAFVESDS
jgi:aspartyl-tRNA(Asn)/glutamyl-tRNA(Gln) amidotransferase subunit C